MASIMNSKRSEGIDVSGKIVSVLVRSVLEAGIDEESLVRDIEVPLSQLKDRKRWTDWPVCRYR